MSSRKNHIGSNALEFLNDSELDGLNHPEIKNLSENKAPKKQTKNELWIWDYTKNKILPGFAVLIAYKDGVCEVLHFNDQWDGKLKYRPNSKKDEFVKTKITRQDVYSGVVPFTFIYEIE